MSSFHILNFMYICVNIYFAKVDIYWFYSDEYILTTWDAVWINDNFYHDCFLCKSEGF